MASEREGLMPAHDSEDIAAWLRGLKLERYVQVFLDAEIDADVLPHLTEADLRELNIPLGPRKKLLSAITELEQKRRTAEAGATAIDGHVLRPRRLDRSFRTL